MPTGATRTRGTSGRDRSPGSGSGRRLAPRAAAHLREHESELVLGLLPASSRRGRGQASRTGGARRRGIAARRSCAAQRGHPDEHLTGRRARHQRVTSPSSHSRIRRGVEVAVHRCGSTSQGRETRGPASRHAGRRWRQRQPASRRRTSFGAVDGDLEQERVSSLRPTNVVKQRTERRWRRSACLRAGASSWERGGVLQLVADVLDLVRGEHVDDVALRGGSAGAAGVHWSSGILPV